MSAALLVLKTGGKRVFLGPCEQDPGATFRERQTAGRALGQTPSQVGLCHLSLTTITESLLLTLTWKGTCASLTCYFGVVCEQALAATSQGQDPQPVQQG